MQRAMQVAEGLGARLRTAESRELQDPRVAANPPDRCYCCKLDLAGSRSGSLNDALKPQRGIRFAMIELEF